MTVNNQPIAPRIWKYVAKPLRRDRCWRWTGSISNGYGRISVNGRMRQAHVVMYELLVGPVPAGMILDHTCHTVRCGKHGPDCPHRRCVNPAHMEPVSPRENTVRGTRRVHCSRGHLFTAATTHWRKGRRSGQRECRTCMALRARARRARGLS